MNVDELVKQIAFASRSDPVSRRFVRIIFHQRPLDASHRPAHDCINHPARERCSRFSLSFAPVLHIRAAHTSCTCVCKRILKVFDVCAAKKLVQITVN